MAGLAFYSFIYVGNWWLTQGPGDRGLGWGGVGLEAATSSRRMQLRMTFKRKKDGSLK